MISNMVNPSDHISGDPLHCQISSSPLYNIWRMIYGAKYSGETNQSLYPLNIPYLLVSNLFDWILNSYLNDAYPH